MNTLGFCFREFKTVLCSPGFYFIETSLESEFYILHIFRFIKDTEIINIQRRVSIINTFNNVINFDIK